LSRRKRTKWTNEELIAKRHQAKAFKDPLVEEFLDLTEEKLFEAWRNSPADNPKEREEIYLQCLGLKAFRKFIEEILILGNMAEAEIVAKMEKEQNRKGQ
jgi:hypothetical protein